MMSRNFIESLVAVLGGNVVYFLLMPNCLRAPATFRIRWIWVCWWILDSAPWLSAAFAL